MNLRIDQKYCGLIIEVDGDAARDSINLWKANCMWATVFPKSWRRKESQKFDGTN